MKYQSFLDDFKVYLRVRDYSKAYVDNVKVFLRYCEEQNINPLSLTHSDFSKFILHLKNLTLTNGTINNYIKSIRFLYSYLNESGVALVDDSVCRIVNSFKMLKIEHKKKPYLSLEELDMIVSQALTYYTAMCPEKIKAILYLMYYTGMRRSEVIILQRKDFQISERRVLVTVPKRRKQIFCYFPKKVEELLKQYFAVESEETNAFNLSIAKMRKLFDFLQNFNPDGKNITAHILRHSFANLLAKKGIDIRVAQKLLGHKSIQSTLIYYDPDDKTVQDIYKKTIR